MKQQREILSDLLLAFFFPKLVRTKFTVDDVDVFIKDFITNTSLSLMLDEKNP